MSFVAIVALAVALAMDAVAVAAARGLAATGCGPREALRVGVLFGGFQALMPALGWWGGVALGGVAARWSPWIAAVLLAGLGVRMLRGGGEADGEPSDSRLGWTALLPLAVATSIDALAAGVSLPLMNAPFALSLAIIGVVTAVLSGSALLLAQRVAASAGGHLEKLGGAVLVGLGARVLWLHLAV
jgi:putative Mn2+ efflux pump MntP